MKRFWIMKGIKVALLAVAAVGVFGWAVMTLWNWLMPPLTGWHAVGFAQAVGLFVLCRILFGGLRGRGGMGWHRMRERFEQATPEERERWRGSLRERFGHAPAAPDQRP